MNQHTAEKLSQWLDHELPPADVAELKTQLAQDAQLRDTFAQMQEVDLWLRQAAERQIEPTAGFTQRFEHRLAHYQPRKPWQIWLAVVALLSGSLLVISVWGLANSTTLLNVGTAALDADVMYQAILAIIESAAGLQTVLNVSRLIGKASLVILSQPMFWVTSLIAVCVTWLWVRALQNLFRRTTQPVEYLL